MAAVFRCRPQAGAPFVFALVVVVAAAHPRGLAAQDPTAATGAIGGRVTSTANGGAIGGASVRALALPARSAAGSVSANDEGRYRLAGLRPGLYAVVATRIGYQLRRVDTVRVRAGETTTLDLALAEAPSQLNQVVTTASRGRPEKALEAPASVSVVTAAEIERRPAITTADLVRNTPGIDATQGGVAQSNVVTRGFNNAFSGSLLMLQDYRFAGVPSLRVNIPLLMTGTSDDVERVEVLLGPASALYGPNSANGVLHVITKSPFDHQGSSISVDGGEQSILRAGVRTSQKLTDRVGFKVSGEFFRGRDFTYADPAEPAQIRRWDGRQFVQVANRRDFDIERYSGEARLDVRPGEDTELITTLGYTDVGNAIELTGANGASQIRNWTYTSLQQRFRHRRLFAQAFLNVSDAGNRDSLDTRGTFLLRSGQPIVDQSRVLSAQLQHGFEAGRTDVVYGADYIFTDPRTGNTINGRNEALDEVTEVGAYVQSTTRLTTKFDLLGAVRVDRNSVIDGSQFSPRAALVFKPTPNHNVRATYNRAFQTPANFAFFLDLIRSRVPGTPYQIRAVGNPPKEGFQFNRSCNTAIAGGLCMRSPFLPNQGAPVAAGGASAYQAFVGLLTANRAALPATFQAVIPALGALAANAPAGLSQIRYAGQPTVVDPAAVRDIAPLEASFNDTYEVGYKGIIRERLRVAIDGWYQRRGDIGTPAQLATPSVFLSRQALGQFVQQGLPAVLQAGGMPAAQAQATAQGVGQALASDPAFAALFQAPLGVVGFTSDLSSRPTDLIATYQPVDRTLNVYGTDVALDLVATDRVTLTGSYSYLSENVFDAIRDPSSGQPFMANTPRHRASLGGRVEDPRGWGVDLRGRYASAFPVNSGVYVSDARLADLPPGVVYPAVPVTMFVDAGVSYRFTVGGRRALWSITGQNILDNVRPTFVGVPAIGRILMTRLKYDF